MLLEPIMFYQNVSPSKELRDASNQAEVLLRDFGVESEMRMDVFIAKKNAAANIKEKLTPEQQRLVDRMLLEGKRAGLELSEDKRKLLTEKKKELSQLCVEFGVCQSLLYFRSLLMLSLVFVTEKLQRRVCMYSLIYFKIS